MWRVMNGRKKMSSQLVTQLSCGKSCEKYYVVKILYFKSWPILLFIIIIIIIIIL